jgi:cobalt/nickel transport system permease protein
MHMADALISPAVGGVLWAAAAGTIAYCSKKVREEMDDKIVPLMGVLGAFIFAAQMINFSIPATGSSGHLGGGLILAILLGPYAGFLVTASVLTVQALFFADGGLLALGCNIFNLGFFPAFIAYPLIYKKIAGSESSQTGITIAAIVAAVAGLQMGAFGVVLETVASGISSLPFSTFILLMQPIHLVIGIVEGLATASVITFVYKARPEILSTSLKRVPVACSLRGIIVAFLAATVVTGGIVSWFASEQPDGLEWSIKKITGRKDLEAAKDGIHGTLASIQGRFAFMPDYSLKKAEPAPTSLISPTKAEKSKTEGSRLGTSVSGIIGGLLTLVLAGMIGFGLRKRGTTTGPGDPHLEYHHNSTS